ncbi:hypothetical protein HNR46_001214 [Haloferula luteola]|uniref:Uncharacterized protein n=1 Tax=Haloferula luteola TaxID=595692 RepID=A0A840VAL1_9BACT|nr:hypothetical protein [Haloferula luteola]MBB5350980.1 hypothetical protein [Haloferula luteola]
MVTRSHACQICVPVPEVSVADRLLAASVAVLAREDSANCFRYQTWEVLKGADLDVSPDLFVDSQVRRQLASRPAATVLCVQSPDGEWRRLGWVTPENRGVIDDILRDAGVWRKDPVRRLKYFSRLLGSEDRMVATMAHLEVGKASYAELRELEFPLSPAELRRNLDDPRMVEWQALWILLLAIHHDPSDLPRVQDRFERCATRATPKQLAAWTTAWIELKGVGAMDRIEAYYLRDPTRQRDEILAV